MSTVVSELTSRFHEICDWEKNPLAITIIGAGSIGSNLAMLLARLGVQDITVYDPDSVEESNLGHQAYYQRDVGSPKAMELGHHLLGATGVEMKYKVEKTDGKGIRTDILVLAVDNMEARKQISQNAEYEFLVDGRMGGETFNIYATTLLEKERYEKTLYSDEEASEAPCGGKAIGYTSYLISGLMEIVIKKIIMGESFPFEQNFCAKTLVYDVSK